VYSKDYRLNFWRRDSLSQKLRRTGSPSSKPVPRREKNVAWTRAPRDVPVGDHEASEDYLNARETELHALARRDRLVVNAPDTAIDPSQVQFPAQPAMREPSLPVDRG